MERALHEDVGFRVLSGNQQPDHWTLSEFRRRHHRALGDLLKDTVRIAAQDGLVQLGHVAVDGTKLRANASKHSAMSYGRVQAEEQRLTRGIDELLEQAEANDAAEHELCGRETGWRLSPALSDPEKRLATIRCAKERLEAEAKEKSASEQAKRKEQAEQEGREYRPRKEAAEAKPEEKSQTNFTDPDSRTMVNSGKAFIQGYNGQAAVDAQSRIVPAADLTGQAEDVTQLIPWSSRCARTPAGLRRNCQRTPATAAKPISWPLRNRRSRRSFPRSRSSIVAGATKSWRSARRRHSRRYGTGCATNPILNMAGSAIGGG